MSDENTFTYEAPILPDGVSKAISHLEQQETVVMKLAVVTLMKEMLDRCDVDRLKLLAMLTKVIVDDAVYSQGMRCGANSNGKCIEGFDGIDEDEFTAEAVV